MPLTAGDKLGPYEILAPIGKGGMGEVYRAHDPRTGRDVAIKISAERFNERFDREVRAVAALNHPNICTLFDVGPDYLVMEYIEGEAPKGPLPLEEALRIARQIAAALQEAHEKNITHRDLKPGNIKVKPDGTVKVLDFGLAKITPAEAGVTPTENSPTLSMAATQAGVILGTAAYMAPEQAKGKSVDKRADIWAFGVVLHELLTGDRLFQHDDLTETLAAVVMSAPKLDDVPFEVRRLLKKCLEKDPKKRLQDIGDVWELLDASTPPSPSRTSWAPWAVAGLLLLSTLALGFLYFRTTPTQQQTLRYDLAIPAGSTLHSFAISPDGRDLAMSLQVNGKRQLWLRPLDSLQAHPMPFTEDAIFPFWSPDSKFIGFFAQGKLKKVAEGGGPSQSLCDVPAGRGGTWSRDDVILFSSNGAGIQRVSAGGGAPADVTPKGDLRHPVFLPDGSRFLYLARLGPPEKNGIYVSSLDGKETRRVLADVSGLAFAPPPGGARVGHILFVRENTLMAQPFDAAGAQTAGDVFPAADNVSLTTNGTYAPVTVSDNGILFHGAGGAAGGNNQIGWYDRGGKLLSTVGAPGDVQFPALSPDEKSVAFMRGSGAGESNLWVYDLNRNTETRFTSDASGNLVPLWSPKGDFLAFSSNRGGGIFNLYKKGSSGTGPEELLFKNRSPKISLQWSRDGQFLVYMEVDPKTRADLWVLPVGGAATDRQPIQFVHTEFTDVMGQLSPDSHWMAYASDESGKLEVYVQPFPGGEGKATVSTAGGQKPRWRADGKELFYEAADGKLMAVPVKALTGSSPGSKPSFEVGAPAALFDAHMARDANDGLFNYDVTADGKRFLINTTGAGNAPAAPPLTVVVNWKK